MSTQTLLSRSVSAGLDTRQCREWLQAAGLRFSMPRLKVVEALCSANDEQGVSARELHRQLSDAGEPLSLVSVRQVLRHDLLQAFGKPLQIHRRFTARQGFELMPQR